VFSNARGERYVIANPPQRIASGTLFTDVILSSICDESRIAALHEVSKNPRFSPIAARSASFPHHLGPDPETILAVKPDLVFLASFSDKRLDQLLSSRHRQVVRLHNLSSIAGVRDSIRAVGYIVGLDRPAEALIGQMDTRLEAVAAASEVRKKWRVLSWADSFVAGEGTILHDVLGYVGARNLASEFGIEGVRRVQPERLLAAQPDALIIGTMQGKEDEALQRLLRTTVMSQLRAVRRQRVLFVPDYLLLSTTQHVASLAEFIAARLDQWGDPR